MGGLSTMSGRSWIMCNDLLVLLPPSGQNLNVPARTHVDIKLWRGSTGHTTTLSIHLFHISQWGGYHSLTTANFCSDTRDRSEVIVYCAWVKPCPVWCVSGWRGAHNARRAPPAALNHRIWIKKLLREPMSLGRLREGGRELRGWFLSFTGSRRGGGTGNEIFL